jgi:hypothetical protein
MPAVELRRAFGGVTIEIDDVAIERNLALELGVVEARTARPLPKDALGARRRMALRAGGLDMLGGHWLTAGPGPLAPLLPLSLRERGS